MESQVTEETQHWDVLAPTLIITQRRNICDFVQKMCLIGPKEYERCVYCGPGYFSFATKIESNWPFIHIRLRDLIESQSLPDAYGLTLILNLEIYKWSDVIFEIMERYQVLQVRVIIFATDDRQLTSEIDYGGKDIHCTTLSTDYEATRRMEWRSPCYEKTEDQLFIKSIIEPQRPFCYAEWRGVDIPSSNENVKLRPYTFRKIPQKM